MVGPAPVGLNVVLAFGLEEVAAETAGVDDDAEGDDAVGFGVALVVEDEVAAGVGFFEVAAGADAVVDVDEVGLAVGFKVAGDFEL